MSIIARSTVAVLALGFALHAASGAGAPETASTAVLVLLPAAEPDDVIAALASLERAGFLPRHVFPGGAVIAERDPGGARLASLPTTWRIIERPLAAGESGPRGVVPRWLEVIWNANYHGMQKAYALDAGSAPVMLPVGDALIPPPSLAASAAPGSDAGNALGAADDNTSEFLSGRVGVALLTPESAGSAENWSDARLDQVKAGVQAGLNQLAAAAPAGRLTFFYRWNDRCPTSIEPISLSSDAAEPVFVSECLTALGFPATTANWMSVSRAYARDVRNGFGADWGFSIYVVDSFNDPDGAFANGGSTYAWVSGPHVVMTYDNGGAGIGQMAGCTQHESGHVFFALDEYGTCSCTATSGYLAAQNQDCVQHCALDVACAMRSDPTTYECPWSLAQMGLADADGDGTPDVRDTFPGSTLDPSPASTVDATPTFSGISTDLALASRNPNGNTTKSDITINAIAGVEYRVDGGAWSAAVPRDGTFDWSREAFAFTTAPLAVGSHTIEVRARNSVGNVEPPPYASRTVGITSGSRLDVASYAFQDADAHEGNANGGVDPGELITLPLSIVNNGSLAETGVGVTVSTTSPLFTILTGTLAYPDLPVGAVQVSPAPNFRFAVAGSATCGTHGSLHVVMTSTHGTWATDIPVFVGPQPLFFDDAESGDGGWTATTIVAAGNNSWARNGYKVANGSWAWEYGNHSAHDIVMDNDVGYYPEGTLSSPYLTLPVTGTLQLSFAHNYDFEYADSNEHDRQDGGWLELDAGRNWSTLTPTGDYPLRWDECESSWANTLWHCFWVNGVDDHANAHAGQRAFMQDGPAGFPTDTVSLDAWRGRTVRFQFHVSCTNGSWEPHNGWWIDDIAIKDTSRTCAPFNAPAPAEVPQSLRVRRTGSNLRFDWGYAAGGARYSLYRGSLPFTTGHPYTHACETGAANLTGVTATLPTPTGSRYWLAVAENVNGVEGPYGTASSGAPVPAAGTPCP